MSLAGAVALGLFFICMEGTIIRILLGAAGGKSGLLTCISYSFLGFFYSGITPSATGGQPMQLYEMKRDGNSVSSSTVVLMVTAVCYKLVLTLINISSPKCLCIFIRKPPFNKIRVSTGKQTCIKIVSSYNKPI